MHNKMFNTFHSFYEYLQRLNSYKDFYGNMHPEYLILDYELFFYLRVIINLGGLEGLSYHNFVLLTGVEKSFNHTLNNCRQTFTISDSR